MSAARRPPHRTPAVGWHHQGMYSGTFPLTERLFDFGDTEALIEITDDKRVRMTRIDADPSVPRELLFDLPASDVKIAGNMGILVIKAAGKKYQSNHAPEITPLIHRARFAQAGKRVAQSGIKEWVQAFKAAGSPSRFVSYSTVFWCSVVFAVLFITAVIVVTAITYEG
jgi:hypothetical protein